jgi:hypothetical protein
MFKKRPTPERSEGPAAPEGTEPVATAAALLDRGIYADWYIRFRLREEIERAARYGRTLTALVAAPSLLDGESISPETLEMAVRAARAVSRSIDLIGWWGDGSIILVMPETRREDGVVASRRWRDEMWMRTRAVKWEIRQLTPEDLAGAGLDAA